MKIELKNTPEQVALFKAMASKDRLKAAQAQEMFAGLISPTIGQILNQTDTTTLFYKSFTYNEEDTPTLPVEPLLGHTENELSVWSNSVAGGLAQNQVYAPTAEVLMTPYRLDSAISWSKKFNLKSRLDVISMYLTRLAQVILIKRNRNAWSVVLGALAGASNDGIANVVRSDTAARFTLADLNHMFTRIRRQNASWVGGTPENNVGKLTDLVMSPEIYEQIREFAYNPVNTTAALGASAAGAGNVVALPEAERAKMFAGGTIDSLFGVRLMQMNEFGVAAPYTVLFDDLAGSTSYAKNDKSGGAVFAPTSDLVLGLDATRDFAWRAIAADADTGSVFSLVADDQFLVRSEMVGFYGAESLAHMITQTRPLQAIIVT